MPGIVSGDKLESLTVWLNEGDHPASTQRVEDLLNTFDVQGTAQRVVEAASGEQYNVALQFPDSLIRFAPLVSEGLRISTEEIIAEKAISKKVFYFILGDTSYGECCVDEVASQHLSSNLIVHYGNTCFSPTRTLPVSYIFPGHADLDSKRACDNFRRAIGECNSSPALLRVVLLYDLELHPLFGAKHFHVADETVEYLSISETMSIDAASLRVQNPKQILYPGDEGWACGNSKIALGALAFERGTIPISQTVFIWFTKERPSDDWPPAIRNAALQLDFGSEEACGGFYCASLCDCFQEPRTLVRSYTILKKRFASLNKIKNAQRIGIVPGTLGISGNVEVIERCKRVIESANKRSYTILVGKPNPSKLANFPEIDAFVLVACPQNALLEGRDYFQPIVTPLELEAALLPDRDIFTMPYSTDFRDLIEQELPPEVTASHTVEDEKAVSVRGDWSVSVREAGGAAEFLGGRSWQGLTYSKGSADNDTDVSELPTDIKQGQAGIASKYDKEVTQTDSTP